jgi:hypothetical protein
MSLLLIQCCDTAVVLSDICVVILAKSKQIFLITFGHTLYFCNELKRGNMLG